MRRGGVSGKIANHEREVEAPIADVERQKTVFGELGKVDAERLAGDEVDGNRVGTERVDDEEIVVMIGRVTMSGSRGA